MMFDCPQYLLFRDVDPTLSNQLAKVVLVVAQGTLEKVPRRLGKLGHAAPMEPAIMTARGTNRFQPSVRSHVVVANPTGLRLRMLLGVHQFDVLIAPRLERIRIVGQTSVLEPTSCVERPEAFLGAAPYIGVALLANVTFLTADSGLFVPDVLFHESEDSFIVVPILDQTRRQKLQKKCPHHQQCSDHPTIPQKPTKQ